MAHPVTTKDMFVGGATVTLDLCTDAWGTPVLFVSTRASAVQQLEARLGGPGDEAFHITHAPRWQAALEALEAQDFAAVLLDAEALDIDPSRAYALLRKVARATPTFTVEDGPDDPESTHVLPRAGLDRRGLLRRIRASSVRRGTSSPGHRPPTKVTAGGDDAAGLVRRAIDALRAGQPPEGLEIALHPLGERPGRPPEALVAQLQETGANGQGRGPLLERLVHEAGGGLDVWRWLLEVVCHGIRSHEVGRVVLPLRLDTGAHGEVIDALGYALYDQGVPPDELQVALSEVEVMADPDAARTWASELRLVGVSVALVQVGAGASRFEVMAGLRPARLELDPGVVARLYASAEARGAAAAIAATAKALGAVPSAAGVEVGIQAELLEELGYGLVRGPWLLGAS